MPEDAGGVRDKIDKEICKYDITECLPVLMGVVINRDYREIGIVLLKIYNKLIANVLEILYL